MGVGEGFVKFIYKSITRILFICSSYRAQIVFQKRMTTGITITCNLSSTFFLIICSGWASQPKKKLFIVYRRKVGRLLKNKKEK
jgi:hypothetical protein